MAVANQKGGVGKTTTAVNLGAALAELGYRVLVVDLDPQGNATTGLGINSRNLEATIYDVILHDVPMEDAIEPTSLRNLFVVPATIHLAGAEIELVPVFSRELRLRRAIEQVTDDFDFIMIDCPPSLGLLTVNGLAAATEVVVPIQCEYYALEGLGQLLRNVNLVQTNLNPRLEVTTIVLTMYDARTRLAEQVVREVRQHFGARVCRHVVPRTVRLSEAPSFGQPIIVFDPSSRGAIAYRELAKEVSGGAAAAGWVGAWRPSSPTTLSATERRRCSRCRSTASGPTPTSPAVTSTRKTSDRSPRPSGQSASCSPSSFAVSATTSTSSSPANGGGGRPDGPGSTPSPPWSGSVDDLGSVEQALIENLHRIDLNPMEEAAAYQQLIEDFGLTHEQLASRVGRSRAAISNTLRLFQLPPSIQRMVIEGQLSAGHARALLGTPDRNFQEALAAPGGGRRSVGSGGRGSGAAADRAQRRGGSRGRASGRLRPPGVVELEKLLSQHLDTRVKVDMGARKGRVVIEFATLEDLERIYRAMTEAPLG